ncbi:helix-turn-helix transcriptional regulator [Aidingimonas lacisalsi]|uniref:helix-turn-helix transcriptional regulator n=1 Tax=Aidingimonas lacisalsi TaxID=2604086 RepID=UPI0011D1A2C0|nr:helix-turn-helix transcriptional regulator [Aidingimonas lacisalsi]
MLNHVRALRKKHGMTQAALAEAMGVSRNTINSIEVGRYVPSLPLALCLARFFGKPVEEVFDDQHEQSSSHNL